MRTVVIGGTGHIGTYLVPRLIRLGHDVTVLSRGERTPYHSDGTWKDVEFVQVDRAAEDAAGTFGGRVADLSADVVIDLICFTEDSARQLTEAVEGKIQHLLHCGTIWVHGPSLSVPTREDAPRTPFGDYGVQKAAIEAYLLTKARRDGFPATIVHPGHICGPGWTPVNPAGNFDLAVYEKLAKGQEVHAVASDAITLRGYAHAVADWFGQKAELGFVPIGRLQQQLPEQDAGATWDHVEHSPHCSMEKAARLLDFRPRYSAFEAALSGISWLVDNSKIAT
jgi:nucleoside-diphosphate-sugar epimerase